MKRRLVDLAAVPELSHVAVVRVALDALEAELLLEHPTLDDPGPRPPVTLRRALVLRAEINTLRIELRRYRRAVLAVLRPPRVPKEDLPF